MITDKEKNFIYFLRKKYESIVLVDVGANLGNYTESVSDIIEIKKGYLFEPIIQCVQELKNKFSDKKFNIFQTCLGSHEGTVELNKVISKESFSSINPRNWFFLQERLSTEKINVPIFRLDGVIEENINLLKIDVEGYELEVLNGSEKLLENKQIDFIQFEYGGTFKDSNITLNDVILFLNKHGYSVYDINNEDFYEIKNYNDDYLFNNFFATYIKI